MPHDEGSEATRVDLSTEGGATSPHHSGGTEKKNSRRTLVMGMDHVFTHAKIHLAATWLAVKPAEISGSVFAMVVP